MTDLFEQVFHRFDDTVIEDEIQGMARLRWMERAHENGILTAIDCISLIFFVLDDFSMTPKGEQERRIVDGWAAELRKAACSGEIQPREPVTLLPLETVPDGWEWLLSMKDADKFIAARGMGWKCSEVAKHLYMEHGLWKPLPPVLGWWETQQPAPEQSPATPVADDAWITQAQARAREIVKESRESDRYPSQENIGDRIAAEFRKAGIVGADGKPLTGATIKRWALKGISSAQGKQLSTTIGRGK